MKDDDERQNPILTRHPEKLRGYGDPDQAGAPADMLDRKPSYIVDSEKHELTAIPRIAYLGRELGYVRIQDPSYGGIDVDGEYYDCEPFEDY